MIAIYSPNYIYVIFIFLISGFLGAFFYDFEKCLFNLSKIYYYYKNSVIQKNFSFKKFKLLINDKSNNGEFKTIILDFIICTTLSLLFLISSYIIFDGVIRLLWSIPLIVFFIIFSNLLDKLQFFIGFPLCSFIFFINQICSLVLIFLRKVYSVLNIAILLILRITVMLLFSWLIKHKVKRNILRILDVYFSD